MENLTDNNVNETIQPTDTTDQPTDTTEDEAAFEKAAAEAESMEDLMNLYEESFKRFAEGEVVKGRII